MKIVILESLSISHDELEKIIRPLLDNGHEVIIYDDKVDELNLKTRVKDADILVIANMPLSGEVIDSAEKLKFISVAFTGVDHIDLDKCTEKNIKVSNAAGYSTNSVAELSFGLIISLLRNIVILDDVVREGGTKAGYGQFDLSGKTLGVLGTGAIGSRVAELGLAFGCNVIAYNRSNNKELLTKGINYMSLEEVLSSSDIVTIHMPLNVETKALINKERLELMKPTAFLINTSRGPIVDNNALAIALENGIIAGAGIDVFDMEPPIPKDYPLLDAPNTILLPHIGFATEEAMVRRADITLKNISMWEQDKQQNIIK